MAIETEHREQSTDYIVCCGCRSVFSMSRQSSSHHGKLFGGGEREERLLHLLSNCVKDRHVLGL